MFKQPDHIFDGAEYSPVLRRRFTADAVYLVGPTAQETHENKMERMKKKNAPAGIASIRFRLVFE